MPMHIAAASVHRDTSRSQQAQAITSGPRAQRRVALTFDDGPNDPHTLRIADILDTYRVRGTFFVVGKAVIARPAIARELLHRGHLVGAHSFGHGKLDAFTSGYPELARTRQVLQQCLGVDPAFYRPPYGIFTQPMLDVIASGGLSVVNWDASPEDWATADGGTIARRTLKRAKAGSIVLLHDGCEGDVSGDRSATVAALPAILKGLAQRRLHAVRLDELLGRPGYLTQMTGRF